MIVFVNGTFDLIHVGHIELLKYAKSLGTHLVVAIDSDERVKRIKGPTRPINNEHERSIILRSIRYVNEVFTFDTDEDLTQLIRASDIMVKGSDYIGKPIIGRDVCKKLIFFERLDEYSTTKKIQNITSR